MAIQFEFDINKASAVMVHILTKLGEVDKAKLIKLLYIADRDCFISLGYPITGDQQYAMKFGPVPSACLDSLNGIIQEYNIVFNYLHVSDNKVMLKNNVPSDIPQLTKDELNILDGVIEKYGDISTSKLIGITHSFPEWRDTFAENTSTLIPYELILKHYGKSPEQYRYNRPVISPETSSRMLSPFARPEPEL